MESNVQKMREAVGRLIELGLLPSPLAIAACPPTIQGVGYSFDNEWCKKCKDSSKEKCKAVHDLRDALAMPLRNCDVGTAEEQSERFMDFCRPGNRPPNCEKCKVYPKRMNKFWCQLEWAQMPCEEGGAS